MLIDVFAADPTHGAASREAMRTCIAEGTVLACEVVWAEVAAGFPSTEQARAQLQGLGVVFAPLDERAALHAGDTFREYRRRGGSRERVIADFLVGSHALAHAERLLSRDRGFYRSYFGGLELLDPSA